MGWTWVVGVDLRLKSSVAAQTPGHLWVVDKPAWRRERGGGREYVPTEARFCGRTPRWTFL